MPARLPVIAPTTPVATALAIAILLLLALAVLTLRLDGPIGDGATGTGGPDATATPPAAGELDPATADPVDPPAADPDATDQPTAAPSATDPAQPGTADPDGTPTTGGADPAPAPGSELPFTNHVALPPGTCVDDDGRAADVSQVEVVDCAQPHTGEVYAAVTVDRPDGAPYPGQEVLQGEAQRFCWGEAFEAYVGTPYTETRYFAYWLAPTEQTWAAGDRDVACVLYDPSGPMTGSQRGSNR